MYGTVTRVEAYPQGRRGEYLDETEKQQALHHEIGLEEKRKRRKRQASPKTYVRIRELERFFRNQYGAILPDDDAGLDSIIVMANHLAHLDRPDKRIASWVRRWAPWHDDDETTALIESVMVRPLKWKADKAGPAYWAEPRDADPASDHHHRRYRWRQGQAGNTAQEA